MSCFYIFRKVQFVKNVNSLSLFLLLLWYTEQSKRVLNLYLEIESQFSRLNLSFSSGRNLTMNEELTISDDVFSFHS